MSAHRGKVKWMDMRRFKKIAAVSLVVLLFSCSLASAMIKRPPARYTVLVNNDIRHSDENFVSNRLDMSFSRELNKKVTARLTPFVEARHNLERRKRERVSTGVEMGLDFGGYFYAGEQLRQTWRSEPVYNRGIIKNTNMTEALSILKLSFPLLPKKDIKGYVRGEYTYDFRLGQGVRVESIAGMLIPFGKSWEVNADWRHRDRIHADDCDTLEAGITYIF